MNSRFGKQLVYGIGFLLIVFLILFGFYSIWFKPAPSCFDNIQNGGETGVDCGGPCAPCEIKTLTPISANWVNYFASGSSTSFAAEVNNPNQNFGASDFTYSFDIYDSLGNKINSFSGNSFIYSRETKYIILAGVNVDPQSVKNVRFATANPQWKSETDFPAPSLQVRGVKTESGNQITVSGTVTNGNAYKLSKIIIDGFLFNNFGLRAAVSRTEIDNVNGFEDNAFKLLFPSGMDTKNIDLNQIKVYAEGIK